MSQSRGKIEIMTQPEMQQDPSESPRDSLVRKLQNLVNEKSSIANDDINNQKSAENIESKAPNMESEESDHVKEEDTRFDHNGFEIPKSKVPVDGNFSTREVQEILSTAKKKGLLDQNIEIDMVQENKIIGDKVVIADGEQVNEQPTEKELPVDTP